MNSTEMKSFFPLAMLNWKIINEKVRGKVAKKYSNKSFAAGAYFCPKRKVIKISGKKKKAIKQGVEMIPVNTKHFFKMDKESFLRMFASAILGSMTMPITVGKK